MKKTVIATLVALAPTVALADVTLYGELKGGLETVRSGGSSRTNLDDMDSLIGFKGSEDVGNGLKTIWQVETGFQLDGTSGEGKGSGTFANRESFIGLAGDFGSVRLGHLSNFQDSDMTMDMWSYKNSTLGLGAYTRNADRIKNAVRYDSPEIAGFKASLLYGVKESYTNVGAGQPDDAGNSTDRDTWNLGLEYRNAGFFGQYAYQREGAVHQQWNGVNNVQGRNTDIHRLELGYDADNLYLALGAQYVKGDADSTFAADLNGDGYTSLFKSKVGAGYDGSKAFQSTEYALTASYTLGALTPKFSYVYGDKIKYDGNKLGDTGYQQVVLGLDYALSKRTVVGAQAGYIKYDGKFENGHSEQSAVGLNMSHTF